MSAIGRLNETDLHEQIKHLYAGPDGATEVTVDGWVVDAVVGGELVEIQTRGFRKLRRKIEALCPTHRLRIVHPVAVETTIIRIDGGGAVISSRRSPRRGRVEEVFREIGWIADLLPHPAITVEAVLVRVVETRIDDGRGSWRRRGVSVVSRALGAVDETRSFTTAADYLSILPSPLPRRFTNQDLEALTGLGYTTVQPITNALRKMGLLRVLGKEGRRQLLAVARRKPARRGTSSRAGA